MMEGEPQPRQEAELDQGGWTHGCPRPSFQIATCFLLSPGNTSPSDAFTGGPALLQSTPSSSSFSSSSPRLPSSSTLLTCTTSLAPSRSCRCLLPLLRPGLGVGVGGPGKSRKNSSKDGVGRGQESWLGQGSGVRMLPAGGVKVGSGSGQESLGSEGGCELLAISVTEGEEAREKGMNLGIGGWSS